MVARLTGWSSCGESRPSRHNPLFYPGRGLAQGNPDLGRVGISLLLKDTDEAHWAPWESNTSFLWLYTEPAEQSSRLSVPSIA